MAAQIWKPENLSPDEILHFRGFLNSIGGSDYSVCTAENFKKYCDHNLDDDLAAQLTKKLSVGSQIWNVISESEFVKFVAIIFRGSHEERVRTLFELASSGSGWLSKDELVKFTESLVKSYVKSAQNSRRFRSWQGRGEASSQTVAQFSEFLLSSLFRPNAEPKDIFKTSTKPDPDVHYEVEDLVDGFSKSNILLEMQTSIFSHCFSFQENEYLFQLIPHCRHVNRCFLPEQFTLLDIPAVMFINSQLPAELRGEWRYLFSSAADGENFSHLLSSIKHQGSTVVVVKSEAGRIFGGFADQCWSLGPKFHGTDKCFLFHLHPKMLAYPSTGFNTNFQYLNIHHQTLPNGLGLGGKLDYFGLWIDAEFGKGKCASSCTTFESPQLSKYEKFCIRSIEVWGVGPIPANEDGLGDSEGGKSIIDQDPLARAVLELINKPAVSDGYRVLKRTFDEIN